VEAARQVREAVRGNGPAERTEPRLGPTSQPRIARTEHRPRPLPWARSPITARPTPVPSAGRLVWIHDVLPDELAQPLAAAMDGGLAAIRENWAPERFKRGQ
jgi:hypothetical protein